MRGFFSKKQNCLGDLLDDALYFIYSAIERTVMFQFDGTHGGGKLARFGRIGTLQSLVEITGRIGVAASGSIHHLMRSIDRKTSCRERV